MSQFQGFGGLVHPARLCTNTVQKKKAQTTKGSMNACMELMGSSTSNKVKNHCIICIYKGSNYNNK